jgi:hypothetical protein
MKDFTYKTTAVALQGRRLVIVSRKGGVWTAATTEAGDHYLRHGTYPSRHEAFSPAQHCQHPGYCGGSWCVRSHSRPPSGPGEVPCVSAAESADHP